MARIKTTFRCTPPRPHDPPLPPSMQGFVDTNPQPVWERQLEMSKEGQNTDLECRCPDDSNGNGSGNKISFHVHIVIVSSHSDFFRSMVSYQDRAGNVLRGYSEQGGNSVAELNIPATAFAFIRDFMYTWNCEIPSEHLRDVMCGAHFLGIKPLFRSTVMDLVRSPWHNEALNLCDKFTDDIPEEVKTYIVHYRAWEARRARRGVNIAQQHRDIADIAQEDESLVAEEDGEE